MTMKDLALRVRKLTIVLATRRLRDALLTHGVAASTEHGRVLRQLGEVCCVVDIGANRGQFALIARACFPFAVIVSFEPLALPAATCRAVFANDARAISHEAAIGPEARTTQIYVSKRDDSSSLLPITATQNAIFPGTAGVGTQIITVAPLSTYLALEAIEEPALLKLDVQGFELQALIGCEDLLARFSWVYAECSFVELYGGQALADEIIAWLYQRGFGLYGVYNMSYDVTARAVQADFLFKRTEPKKSAA